MFLTNVLVFVTLFVNGYVLGVSIFQLYILRTFIKAMRNSPEVVSGEHYQAVREREQWISYYLSSALLYAY